MTGGDRGAAVDHGVAVHVDAVTAGAQVVHHRAGGDDTALAQLTAGVDHRHGLDDTAGGQVGRGADERVRGHQRRDLHGSLGGDPVQEPLTDLAVADGHYHLRETFLPEGQVLTGAQHGGAVGGVGGIVVEETDRSETAHAQGDLFGHQRIGTGPDDQQVLVHILSHSLGTRFTEYVT